MKATNKKLTLRTIIIPLFSLFVILIILIYLIVGKQPNQILNKNQCNNELTGDRNQAVLIYESCRKVIDSTDNISTLNLAYKNAGRAFFVIWDQSSQEVKDKKMNQVINKIKRYFSVAEEANQKDPQAKFYSAYMKDFDDFVETPETLDCLPASERYQEAIQLYREGDNIESVGKDFFAVLELGHFLVSRDANQVSNLGDEYWDNLNGYQKAVELYRKLQVSDKDANYIVLLDKGKAYFLNRNYPGARNSWEEALKIEPRDYQIKYYIGNSWALQGKYDEAIKRYDKVTEDPNIGEDYEALRNSGFAYYILNNYEKAKNRFERALKILGQRGTVSQSDIEFIERYRNKIRDWQCDQGNSLDTVCYQEDKTRRLVKNDITRKGILTSVYTVHRKDKPTDPFIDIEHDSFYKCRIKPEF
ncbi:MAG: tetratricopeptide repeat protein [Cyanobacteria bacterium P01_H01_bin.35]